jgi:hypothetical protein
LPWKLAVKSFGEIIKNHASSEIQIGFLSLVKPIFLEAKSQTIKDERYQTINNSESVLYTARQ